MIDVRGLRWRFRAADRESLRAVELTVPQGQTLVLCGASGSGKSTLLRACSGLVPHLYDGQLDGSVRTAGLDVASAGFDRLGRRIGLVSQHPRRQFFADRVIDELVFASENFGVDPDRIGANLEATVEQLSLAPLLTRRLSTLSGGQQQRVAIASALVHRPDLLLLDEPTSNLSASAIDEVVSALAAVKATGTTIVIAEHRLHAVAPIADRLVMMADGRVEQDWDPFSPATFTDEEAAALGLRSLSAPTAALPLAETGGARASGGSVPRPGLTVRDLTCTAAGQSILDVPYAEFPRGAVTAVVGENGAGKSTLLRVLAGLQRHRGAIALDGVDLPRRRRRGRTAMVHQDVGRQLFFASVRDEVAEAAPDVSSAAASRVLHRFGLATVADRHPLALSGGQQQRLAMATAGLSSRDVLLFDEPSSGVDRRNLDALVAVIRDAARRGAVVVLVTHDEALLARAADSRLVLTGSSRASVTMDG
ncbi:ABC transporter ATP-binding protein [Gordonia hydrophobica]|uniref:ABC transporter ATP-binding protein n=1 Tax=Gordonia hydrophobica TaxID=40516 RepID=A0ABZ2U337_9ACTN|nr:ABC transporter ATP-binding protein [Gordonia hydrophobica]MBM7367306.1 energy-coupling factor transport system ATP-binding protein [Gordonia hydrophobica]